MESSVSSSHSWWWDSHISPKNSKWLQENLTFMDSKVKAMLLVLEEDGDSFVKRAEMYFRKRPQLINLVEEFYRAYRALAERYDNLTGEIRQNIPKSLQSKYGIGDDTIPIQRGMRRKSTTDMASPKPSTPASYNDSVNAPSPLRSARGSASSLLFYNSDYESDAESAIVTDLRQEPKKGFDKERQNSAKPIKSLVSEDSLMLENEELRRKVKDGTEKMKNISALLEALEQDNSSLQQSKREAENELESLGLKVLKLSEEAENLRRSLQEESKEKGRLGADMQCVQHSLYVLTERSNEDYGQLKEEVLHLQEQKVGLEKQCLSLNRRVSDLERETEDLKIKLQLTKEEQTKLGVELAAVKLALKNLSEKHNADCSQLREKLDCAKVQNSNLMADLSSRLFQLKYLEEKVLSLEKDKVNLIAEVKLWSERSNALEADISLQQQQYEGVRKRFEDGDLESQRLGLELSESHARVEALGKENSFLMTELQALNQRIHGIQNDAEGLRRSLQDSVEEKVKVEAELQAVRQSLYASTEKYETENGQLKKQVAHLQGAILASEEKYDADCGYLRQVNADLAAQMSTRVGQLRDMEEKVSALEKEKANLEAEAELLQKRVEEKEAENQRVSLEIEALQKQLHSFRQQTEELNSLCEEYGQEKETAEKTRQELEHRVSVQMGEILRLELTAALEAGKIEKLWLNLGRVQEEKLILCNERDGLADELSTMHALMKGMAEEKASLQRGNEDLESEAGTLKQQIASLQNQVHELLILSADKDEQALKLQRTLGTLQEEYNKESESSRQRYLQLQEELHSLKVEKEHMFEEKCSLLKERDEAETELASWMQQTAKLQEDLSQLLVAGTRKDEQALKLKEERVRLGIAIQTTQEECSNAVTQLKEAEQKCTHFQQELSMVQLEEELQVRDVSNLNECLRELAQERGSLQKRTEDLQSQLSSFREKMEAQMSSLNLEKEQFSDELGNARTLLKALTEEKSSLQKGIEDLGSDLELWKSRTNELQEKLHHQRQEEEELKNGLQASKEHEVKTKLEIQELQLELMTLKENYELKVEKCNRFESECMDLKERALKLEDVQTLEHKSLFQFQDDKVSMMEEEINKLQIDLFNSRTETEHLSYEVKTTAQRFRASEDNCNELQMQIVRLENELSYGECCMEKLRAEIARLQNEKEAAGEEVACTNEVLSENHVVDEASPKEDKVVVKKRQLKKGLRSEKEGRLKNESMSVVLHHYQKEESNGRVVYANDRQGHLVNNSQSLIDKGAEDKNKERKKDLVDIRKEGDRRQVKVSCQRLKKALRVQNEEKIDVEQELESRIKQVRDMQEEIGRLENEKHELLGKMKIESERFQQVEQNVQILQVQNQNYEQEIALLVKKEKRYLTTLRFMRAQVVCLVRKIKDLRAEVENRTKEALNEVEALKEVDVQQSPKLKRIGTQLRVLLEAERMQAEAERAKLGKLSMDTIQEEPKNVSKTVHEEGGGSIGLKRKKKGYRPVCFPRLRYRRKPGLERKE